MNSQQNQITRIIFEGGLQKHIPRDEGLAYANFLLNDAIHYCIKDLTTKDANDDEKNCLHSFLTKNFLLLNSQYL